MTQSSAIKSLRVGRLIHTARTWLEPRSTDRDEAFRERILRVALAIIVVLGLLSFLSSIFIYHNSWSLISFPSLHVAALTLYIAVAFILSRGYLLLAGWILVLTILLSASGIILLLRQNGAISGQNDSLAMFFFVPLVSSLVLTRNSIAYATFSSMIAFAISRSFLPIGPLAQLEANAWPQLTTSFLLLFMEGVLLRQLRGEFDARLETMSRLVSEKEFAKQQAEEARIQAEHDRKRAETADKAKSQFLANMSHELRTPLNAIIGFDEAMLGGMAGTFTPKQAELLGHIQKNGRRLLGLINDILDLSKIEAGALELYLSPVSPSGVIGEIIQSLQSLAHEKNIQLGVDFSDSTPTIILGDKKKLEQVLTNLLSNAIKFTPNGEITVTTQAVDDSTWQFSVRDTGIGINADSLDIIFDPFKQLDSSISRKYKGTGLGLAITKRLVEAMSGSIGVVSEPGKGSVFTVTLSYTAPSATEGK